MPPEQLAGDARPLRYAVELTLDPRRDRFEGSVAIEVELRRDASAIWLHAQGLAIRDASAEVPRERVRGALLQATPDGVARLVFERAIPAGRATLRVAFTGAWSEAQAGLLRVRAGGAAYAYSRLGRAAARRAFPCFDDPRFRAPFDVTLVVADGDLAVSNAPVAAEESAGAGLRRVRFARTAPLAAGALLLAAGPFEPVEAAPLPKREPRARALSVRGLAPRGAAGRLAAALEATRELLPILERWFGVAFPFPKLELLLGAPGGAGDDEAMAGAIALEDPEPARVAGSGREPGAVGAQRLAAALAAQWVGGWLATPREDAWLGGALASLAGSRAIETWRPDPRQPEELAARLDQAMQAEALLGARAGVEPLRRVEGARALAPSVVKGAASLRGLARHMGEGRFRAGVREALEAHAYGPCGAEELAAALSRAAGREVAPVLRSAQVAGVPLVEARSVCGGAGPRVDLDVARYRPLGSKEPPDLAVALPVCVRYEAAGSLGEACTIVEGGRASVTLPACPRWIMPGAGGGAYQRWLLAPADLSRLRETGLLHLAPAERLAYAHALTAAARAGRIRYGELLLALAPFARDGVWRVATSPMPAFREAIDHLVPEELRPQARARAAELFRPRLLALGMQPAPAEPPERRRLRGELAEFLVQVARDREITRALAARGVAWAGLAGGEPHPDAVSPDLVPIALEAAVIEGDAVLFEAVLDRLRGADASRRGPLVAALASARAPELSEKALALAGDPGLAADERGAALFAQASWPETRDAAWSAVKSRGGALAAALTPEQAERLPEVAAGLCDRGRLAEVRRVFAPRVDRLPRGGERLAEALAAIELCAALREAQGASAAAYFTSRSVGAERPSP